MPTGDSAKPTPRVETAVHTLGIRQAAFIGVGSMVGAGDLLGAQVRLVVSPGLR
jgi:hypothetical protein